jgi:hypothetical protein
MSIETTIMSAIAQTGARVDAQHLLEHNEGHFNPTIYPDQEGATGAIGRVQIMTRMSGVRVLRVLINSGYLISDAESSEFEKWAATQNRTALFARVVFRGNRMGGDFEFKIGVESVLPLQGLREEFLVEVLNDMLRLWQEAMGHVTRVNARLEHIKRMNEKAEMEERWLREQYGEDEEPEEEEVVVESATTSPELIQVMSELDALTGLSSVKSMVRGLIASHRVAQKRAAAGLPVVDTPSHLVFSGNPGTGKTTVARLIGRIYTSLGMLSQGHVVEVGRADLVGMYIGHTAMRTREVCKKALGGVLFIDEAYSLNVAGRDFGDEAIETLLMYMEEHRGDIVVVVAGYPTEMEKFLDANTGLRSRFGTTINFEDLSVEELMETFDGLLLAQQYEVTAAARRAVQQHFHNARTEGTGGNARLVRNVFEELVTHHAVSLSGLEELSIEQLRRITALAVPSSWSVGEVMLMDDLPQLIVGE